MYVITKVKKSSMILKCLKSMRITNVLIYCGQVIIREPERTL